MSRYAKYCPDIECDFWEDFPNGYSGKKLRKCPFCLEELTAENNQVNPRQQEVEEIFEDPIGDADDKFMKLVPKQITDNIEESYEVIEHPSVDSNSEKIHVVKGEESDILTSFLKITTVSTRNDTSDKTKTESKPIIGAETQKLLVQKHKQGMEKEMILQTKLKPNRNQLLVRKHNQEMEKEMILQTKLKPK
eukprot:TRINITY_DN535_c0_g1_i2.p1 TRINITY_DN535_c0_g1~~TRINITY_DN535_c0_g1_i2.p1  ORF type:complete len:192 (-),score=29.86 TRINITY_DN535_c0_g1_i2:663-1238(-)